MSFQCDWGQSRGCSIALADVDSTERVEIPQLLETGIGITLLKTQYHH